MRFFSLTTTTSGSAFGNWPIIKQIAWVLGLLMQGIFIVLSGMGIRSVAACIIVFTVITKMLMLPLTIKQQKFTKVNALMTPEIQAIQKKYANKKDQASMAKMQLEQQQVYDKYGSSMSAGCLLVSLEGFREEGIADNPNRTLGLVYTRFFTRY